MKKTTVFVVCMLLLCGGAFRFYLAAQTKETENKEKESAQSVSVMLPIPVDALPAIHFLGEPLPVVEPTVDAMGELHRVPVHSSYPPIVPAKSRPDIGKFRVPIEYKLKNIPAALLKEFLAEQFDHVEAAAPKNKTGMISITASLEDHRTIKCMLLEIECEIEALRSAAAEEKKREDRQIVVFPIKYTSARSLVKHVARSKWDADITVNDRTNALTVRGTSRQIAEVEALLQQLDQPVQKSPWQSRNQ